MHFVVQVWCVIWLIFPFLFIPSLRVVPVCVAAEQRIMLSAAAFSMSSDRGELLQSNIGDFRYLDVLQFKTESQIQSKI